jgi:tetratricopeptide (TPR) repeat protein
VLNSLGLLALERGENERAMSSFEEGLPIAREIGAKDLVATLLNNLGEMARITNDYKRARALYEECLAATPATNNDSRAVGLLNLGLVTTSQGDYAAARSFFLESLKVIRSLGDQPTTASCLEGLAGVYGLQGQPKEGAWLLGAAEALRKTPNLPVQTGERAHYESSVAALRAGLSEAVFAAAWAEGSTVTREQAIEHALREEHARGHGTPRL